MHLTAIASTLSLPERLLRRGIVLPLALSIACGGGGLGQDLLPLVNTPPPGEELERALHQTTAVQFHHDADLKLVFDADVFDALRSGIARAQHSVDIVLYIWRPGEPSASIIRALKAQTARGVTCRVLIDPVGSTPEFEEQVQPRLEEVGCDVRIFRPLKTAKREGSRIARNHRKLVIIDGEVGFTGGFGFSKEWMGTSEAKAWRDTAVRVEGQAVEAMQVAFAQNWEEAGGALLPASDFPQHVGPGHTSAGFVASSGQLGPTNADRLNHLIFGSARERLWVANAYFVPPETLLTLLENKATEGVDVRLLVPGELDDSIVALNGQRALYERLLRHGVRIWEYQPVMMHAKTTVVDHQMALVGSINLDPLSLNLLEEGCVVATSPEINTELAAQFERDLKVSKEIQLGASEIPTRWRRWKRKLFSWSESQPVAG